MTAHFTVGDKGTVLTGTCSDNGTPVDLAGSTVELHIQPPQQDILTRAATTGDNGTWTYAWAVDELTVAGPWKVEAQVTSSDGTVVQTFGPIEFQVRPQLG